MGFFEEQPWLLVPLILAVVVVYDGVKWAIRRALDTRTVIHPTQHNE